MTFAPDLKDPGLYQERIPHDIFARLRREAPVYWNPESDGAGFWAITRYADIVEVEKNAALFSSDYARGGSRIFNENEVGVASTGSEGDSPFGIPFISTDPPVHSDYRRLVQTSFLPGRIAGVGDRITGRVTDLLDKVPLGEAVDLVPLVSAPLPLLTLAELLDVPSTMWVDLYNWTNAFVGEDDPEFRRSPADMAAIMGGFMGFAQELFTARRANPGEDIASLLANAEIQGKPIALRDFIANLVLVLVGGNETTRNSISHTVAAFAANPEQWDKVRADPEILNTAVREMVRHATPVIHFRRTATADTELHGQRIRAGDKVVVWYSSGNRDETVFDEPDRFDITRPNNRHLGFGSGPHICVGSRLAELQLKLLFTQLAARVRKFELVSPPRRFRSNFINGLKNLDVILTPA